MKEFNTTGVCIPEKHYIADVSKKITEIEKMVEEGKYFTINKPRQSGKTTILYLFTSIA
ncbi:MAG: PD-(D/E)XK nuclease superfamily [Halanaerobium sp.]|nr:MAG: PD-(D/E)XK nuclease superfamily [Halanaerobium sp.]